MCLYVCECLGTEKKLELCDVFLQNDTALCRRFTTFVTKYNLMSKDNLIVPILEEQMDANESQA